MRRGPKHNTRLKCVCVSRTLHRTAQCRTTEVLGVRVQRPQLWQERERSEQHKNKQRPKHLNVRHKSGNTVDTLTSPLFGVQ